MPAVPATSPSGAMERDLLFHQTAAIVAWLKEQKLDEAVETFETAIHKELLHRYGADPQLPTEVQGHWKWVPQEAKAEESDDEDEEEEEEESGSDESESDEESSDSSEYETDSSSEYETDSEDESEKEKDTIDRNQATPASKEAIPIIREQQTATRDGDKTIAPADTTNPRPGRKGMGRSVSFDDSVPNEFFYSPIRKNEKANAFWTKKELREIKNEEAMEKMAAIMSQSVFNVPGLSS